MNGQLSKLERELVLAIVGRLGGNFHKATVVSKIAASIALELAERAYEEGAADYRANQNLGWDEYTFKQFIQDYE